MRFVLSEGQNKMCQFSELEQASACLLRLGC